MQKNSTQDCRSSCFDSSTLSECDPDLHVFGYVACWLSTAVTTEMALAICLHSQVSVCTHTCVYVCICVCVMSGHTSKHKRGTQSGVLQDAALCYQ